MLLVEALRWTDEDELALQRVLDSRHPVVCVVNKIDRVFPRERLLPYIEELAGRAEFLAIVPISALRAANLDDLRRTILAALPEGERMFPPGQITDRSDKFRIAESIRENRSRSIWGEGRAGSVVVSHTEGKRGRHVR